MPSLLPPSSYLLLLALLSPSHAYSNNHWSTDFDTFHKWKIIRTEPDCALAYASLNHATYNSNATALIDCILAHTSEVTKAEFGTVAVLLGLLPSVLQLLGPKLSDLSLLALRRPFLSLLLTIGSPCPALDYETTGMQALLDASAAPYWPVWLRTRRTWVTCGVSAMEYALVLGAAGNVVYQFYRLTFYSVVLISTQLGQYGGTLEAFAPLLWVFLGVPIHALGVAQLRWCRVPGTCSASSAPEKGKDMAWFVRREFTPCAWAEDEREEIRLRNGPLYQVLNLGD